MRYSLNQTKYLMATELLELEKCLTPLNRNSLLLLIGLKTGARATELLNLTQASLNPSMQTVYIRGIKGSSDREIPLAPDLFKALTIYSSTLTTERLFPISYSRLKQIWSFYRPVPKKFHSLRHTFAIELYKKTRDLRLVQVALGHRSISNTMIYADYIYSQEELRRLIL